MYELFGFSSKNRENVVPYLIEFYSHCDRHPHGWGIADVHGSVGVEKQPGKASSSRFLPHLIKELQPTDLMMAHIRYATVGSQQPENCHPFEAVDASGTSWTFMHNGTIFQGDELGKYQAVQAGTTDSEPLLLYLIDRINAGQAARQANGAQEPWQTNAQTIEEVIFQMAPGNKLNLIMTDGTRLYVHTNQEGTLYQRPLGSGVIFATVPLDKDEEWTPVEMNRLLVFEKGEQVYRGPSHEFTYVPASEIGLPWYDPGEERTLLQTDPLGRAVYHKYILPTRRVPRDYVGVELEFPIVNLNHGPVDFDVIHQLSTAFSDTFGMDRRHFDDEGFLYSAYSSTNGDDLSFDCSYNTLEISFGRERDINVLYQRFCTYYTWIQDYLRPFGHTLTGMGINPGRHVNVDKPVESERYRMLLHYLKTCQSPSQDPDVLPLHAYPNFGLFSCASQVQMDVGQDQVAPVLRVFNKLEPLKSVLFANSYFPEQDFLLSRDYMWDRSAHGINPHNTGMYEVDFQTTEEVVNYIRSMSIYSLERGGKYINFPPIPLNEYIKKDYVTGEYFDGDGYKPVTFQPQMEDVKFVRTFKLNDLTFRGTVEFRSVCEQPVSDVMACAAFHAGLMTRYEKLEKLLDGAEEVYGRGFTASELRRDLNRCTWPAYLDRDDVSRLLLQVLDVAKAGLKDRGMDEEKFLEPLYKRARTLESPARYMKRTLDAGGNIDDLIREFSTLAPE